MKFNKSFLISLLIMILISSLYRAMPNRPWGFAPQWAIAIFAGAIFRNDKKWAFILPVLSMFISDLFYQVLYLNGLTPIAGFYGGQWLNYLLFAGLAFYGFVLQTQKLSGLLGAAIAAPTTYFILSNFIVWAGGGGYHRGKTLAGLMATYADGLPFYRTSIISTIIFGAVLFGSYYLGVNRTGQQQLVKA